MLSLNIQHRKLLSEALLFLSGIKKLFLWSNRKRSAQNRFTSRKRSLKHLWIRSLNPGARGGGGGGVTGWVRTILRARRWRGGPQGGNVISTEWNIITILTEGDPLEGDRNFYRGRKPPTNNRNTKMDLHKCFRRPAWLKTVQDLDTFLSDRTKAGWSIFFKALLLLVSHPTKKTSVDLHEFPSWSKFLYAGLWWFCQPAFWERIVVVKAVGLGGVSALICGRSVTDGLCAAVCRPHTK